MVKLPLFLKLKLLFFDFTRLLDRIEAKTNGESIFEEQRSGIFRILTKKKGGMGGLRFMSRYRIKHKRKSISLCQYPFLRLNRTERLERKR